MKLIKFCFPGKEPGVFDVVIINDDLEKAYEELKEILNEVSKTKKMSLLLFLFVSNYKLKFFFFSSLSFSTGNHKSSGGKVMGE